MSTIVAVGRQRLALGAEVSIVADSTLVAISMNVAAVVSAQRAVAVDVVVNGRTLTEEWDRLVQWDKSMAWVTCSGTFDACRTEIPVRTIQALVTCAIDVLM